MRLVVSTAALPVLCAVAVTLCVPGCHAPQRLAPYETPSLDAVPIGWGIGQAIMGSFSISPAEWDEIVALFDDVTAADQERRAVAYAVARFEQIAGTQTPTHLDRPANTHGIDGGIAGQMDCVDESTNTTRYLALLEAHGVLRFHVVLRRAFRNPYILDTHHAAQLQQSDTGARWVIDSWFRAPGEPAVIQSYDAWRRKEPYDLLPVR